MTRSRIVALIEEISKSDNAFDTLEKAVGEFSNFEVGAELLHCGIIPERYRHDSSEEKLWAKYCDILLSRAFNSLDIPSDVIRVRGDSADIRGKAVEYSIVADAKAFRLSRTAKNQKDFKITALDDWRRGDTYACLVAPAYQYPSHTSQIYAQAEEKNVTLLSYVHVRFLTDHMPKESLSRLWNTAGDLPPSKNARRYWEAIDDNVVSLTNTSFEELRQYKRLAIDTMSEIGKEGIVYWESVKRDYHRLSKEKAILRLIEAEKIDQKIQVIRKSIDKVSEYLDG